MKRKENMADVLAPVDGVIVEVNSDLREKPELAKQGPYDEGWLFMIRNPHIREAAKRLMTDIESTEWMTGELNRLEKMIDLIKEYEAKRREQAPWLFDAITQN